jgi:arabinogalactan endo-1,4-beta-galactosidase
MDDRATNIRDGDCDTGYFFKGHDLSSMKLLEDGGSIYKDTSRQTRQGPLRTYLATEA